MIRLWDKFILEMQNTIPSYEFQPNSILVYW